jgi:uncharacterized phage protein (TIGR01671 family)
MREIKFRVWDEQRKKLAVVETFYFGEGVDVRDVSGKGWFLTDPTLMQYTGLHDRNGGIAIYESDICRVYDVERYCICNEWEDCEGEGDAEHRNHGEHKHEKSTDCEKYICTQKIEWRSSGYFCDEDTGDFCPPLGADEIELEIIGNIYENPDLLTNEK